MQLLESDRLKSMYVKFDNAHDIVGEKGLVNVHQEQVELEKVSPSEELRSVDPNQEEKRALPQKTPGDQRPTDRIPLQSALRPARRCGFVRRELF